MTGGMAAPAGRPALVLDVQAVYAGFWRRAWAIVLDLTFDGLMAMVLFGYTDPRFSWPLFVTFLLLHHVGFAAEGGTIGKRVLGLRLVRLDGSRVGVGRAALRELVRLTASSMSLGLGFLWMLDQRQRQAWHDIAGGTIVVRELRGDPGPPWRYNPPWVLAPFGASQVATDARSGMAGWASMAPVSPAPSSVAGAQAVGGAERIDPNTPVGTSRRDGVHRADASDPFAGPGDDAGDETAPEASRERPAGSGDGPHERPDDSDDHT